MTHLNSRTLAVALATIVLSACTAIAENYKQFQLPCAWEKMQWPIEVWLCMAPVPSPPG